MFIRRDIQISRLAHKSRDLSEISGDEIKWVEHRLRNRPHVFLAFIPPRELSFGINRFVAIKG